LRWRTCKARALAHGCGYQHEQYIEVVAERCGDLRERGTSFLVGEGLRIG
jgi:hypothetical protein